MEEASPEATKKRKSEDLEGHGLTHVAKIKKSQETRSILLAETKDESQEQHRQDLFPEHLMNQRSHGDRCLEHESLEPPQGGGGEGRDLISRLPDEMLGEIISKLPTKEGARSQILASRWRPLWRSSPLNLQVDHGLSGQERKRISITNKILSTHQGPGRSLYLRYIRLRNLYPKFDRWFRSPALRNLEELDFMYATNDGSSMRPSIEKPLPPSALLRFSSTLRIFSLGNCHFPTDGTTQSLHFPKLKQLTLRFVTISEDAIHGLLSACPALESLLLLDSDGFRRVCIRSRSIRSVGVATGIRLLPEVMFQELIIRDAHSLQRLLIYDPDKGPRSIQVTEAPKLEVLGYLSNGIAKLEIGTTVFKEMIAVNMTPSTHTVKVLVLTSTSRNLGVVLDLLKCFPCLENMYIMFSVSKINMENAQKHSPLGPINCLVHHLKKIVIRGYQGNEPDIDFSKFFVLNARVLEKMKFGVPKMCNDKWRANQHRGLQIDKKASQDAQFQFTYDYWLTDGQYEQRTHDMSMSDPFGTSLD